MKRQRFTYKKDGQKPRVPNYPRAFGALGEAVTRYMLLWYAIPHVIFPDGRAISGHNGDQANADMWLGFPAKPGRLLDGLRPAEIKTVNWETKRGVLDMIRVSYKQHELLWGLDGVLFLVRAIEFVEKRSFIGAIYAARYAEIPHVHARIETGRYHPRFVTEEHLGLYFHFLGGVNANRTNGKWRFAMAQEAKEEDLQWLAELAMPRYDDV